MKKEESKTEGPVPKILDVVFSTPETDEGNNLIEALQAFGPTLNDHLEVVSLSNPIWTN